MLIYRDLAHEIDVVSRLNALSARSVAELGEIESAVIDKCPQNRDLAAAYDRAMRAAVRGNWDLTGLADISPRFAHASTPEGFAFYGLDPQTYADAAAAFDGPRDVVVTGIRSIGTTLSAYVAVALEDRGCRVERILVRPEGHPFDRRVRLPANVRTDAWVAIVDEGPGLSGSSFCGTARAWIEAGVPQERIVFFPSWDPDPAQFRNEQARAMWRRHRRLIGKYTAPFDGVDISAGGWRERLLPESEWPAVHTQHERRKYLLRDGRLAKFHGLGSYGAPAFAMAQALGEFVPRPLEFDRGYIVWEFADGRIAPACDRDLIEHIARYVHFRSELGTGDGVSFDELCRMVSVNVPEAPDLERFRAVVVDQPKIAIDGRMMPHEWIRTPDGFVKADAVDHCRDHFYPGYQDPAWDLAGAIEEFGMDAAQCEYLMERYGGRWLSERVEFYRIAYLAFQIGYAEMAGAMDDSRFERLAGCYRRRLNALLWR